MSRHKTTITVTSPDETEEYTLVVDYSYAEGSRRTWEDEGWPDMIEDWSCRCTKLKTYDGEGGDFRMIAVRDITDKDEQICIGNRVASLQEEQIMDQLWEDVADWNEEPEYTNND